MENSFPFFAKSRKFKQIFLYKKILSQLLPRASACLKTLEAVKLALKNNHPDSYPFQIYC